MLEAILNFIFPPHCPACKAYVEHQGHWCSVCLSKFLLPRRLPLEKEMLEVFSGGIVALGVYEDPLRELIRQLKYDKRKSVVKGLNFFVQQALDGSFHELSMLSGDDKMLAVAVPLHSNRLKERGFNQDELIFKAPMEKKGIKWASVLVRNRYTQPQFSLDREQRRSNLLDAFSLKDEIPDGFIKNKRIVLVDDITTSGSTMLECGKVLKAAGAESLMGLVLASGRK